MNAPPEDRVSSRDSERPGESAAETRGRLVVVSGPSGVGKTTVCDRVREQVGTRRVITVTTRAPRGGEVDGVDYHFVDLARFRAMVAAGDLLEHAEVYGNFYGTPRAQVEAGIARGETLLLNIDVQGAAQIRASGLPELRTVFLAPPSLEVLAERLRARSTDCAETQARRLEVARAELEEQDHYDHVIVNERLEDTIAQLVRIVADEPDPREHRLRKDRTLQDG